MRKQNKKDVNNFRMRNKAIATEILAKQKATQTLTVAIRAKKARIQVNKLRDEKERQEKVKNEVSSILNSIIDVVPVKSKNKKNREAVARHKERKELGQTRTYDTRSKGRTLNFFFFFFMYCHHPI